MRLKISIFIGLIFLFNSCQQSGKQSLNFSVKNLKPDQIILKHYGKELFNLDTSNLLSELQRIQPEFEHFLGADLTDSNNFNRIYNFVTDSQLIALYKRCTEVFPDDKLLRQNLTNAFRRLHHYFPMQPIPEVFTYVSGVQYEMPVFSDGNIVVAALDCYLGKDEIFYESLGIPKYFAHRMTPQNIVNDILKSIYTTTLVSEHHNVTILDEMIHAGKKYYFLEAMQPDIADHILIGYTEKQLKWLKQNEKEVWAYIVSNQFLYSTDFKLLKKLFADGPFTQDFSDDAPARIGEWVGWQIVRQYMKNNPQTELPQLLLLNNSQDVLTASRYKPK